ncbi:hypothetical protein ACGF0D_10775 [Kitasatospora sp. NPDC048298]|uniref:hypothetical protein n=1 Tax=Kitasatospora sp. NPDC048298 TaxID=3364049 RepID=UPI00371EC41F
MPPFVVRPKAYRLVFQDADLAGLEVTARSLNTGQFLEFQAARLRQASGGAAAEPATQTMLQMLADAIVSWNAQDEDGRPIPPTMDGLCGLELDFNMAIISAWMDAINGVPAPLSGTSAGGQPSVEASIPMDVPSASPVS